jgi:hypothetical protein
VSGRRGSAVRLVNAASTSQVIPGTSLFGRRVGDRHTAGHCRCGERNIRSRSTLIKE